MEKIKKSVHTNTFLILYKQELEKQGVKYTNEQIEVILFSFINLFKALLLQGYAISLKNLFTMKMLKRGETKTRKIYGVEKTFNLPPVLHTIISTNFKNFIKENI
jgi:hypothetical protein